MRMASSEVSSLPPKLGGKDPCWEYGVRLEPNNANKVRCKYCQQVLSGGITRLKQHLAGIKGNCKQCAQVPENVKGKIIAMLYKSKKKTEAKKTAIQNLLSDVRIGEEDEDEVTDGGSSQQSIYRTVTEELGVKFAWSLEESVDTDETKQTIIDSNFMKKAREDTVRYIAKWFYEGGIAFNTATLPSFQQMLQAIGESGKLLEAPTPYELSETYLQREVEEIEAALASLKRNCCISGCTLITDAWSNRKNRSIMNIVVHCPAGVAFLHSKSASAEKHCIYQFVEDAIKDVGPDNVVQIVMNGVSNNMSAAKTLRLKRPNIFWTSCATHTINLMLSDIGKIKSIQSAITMGRLVTIYIYSHAESLSLMRDKVGEDIVRPGATRFATTFLSLSSMREKKKDLQQLFTCDEWMGCTLSKTDSGKKIAEIIASNKFWDNVDLALKVFTPLVKVLRRVDGHKMPSMGWVYGDLENAKEEIKLAVDGKEKKYLLIWKIIDKRWDDKLKGPLHRAGYYLNPYLYYAKREKIEKAGIFMDGFTEVMHKFYPTNSEVVEKIRQRLPMYQFQEGRFGWKFAKTYATKPNNPAIFWQFYGTDAPELRTMAMRVLNLTTSSSYCERNWSTCELVEMKKRNRLSPKRLYNLIFVKLNTRLKNKLSIKDRDPLVAYDDEEEVTEWLVHQKSTKALHVESDDEVFHSEQLIWRQVAKATGANPKKRKSLRIKIMKSAKKTRGGASSSKSKGVAKNDKKDRDTVESSFDSSSDEEPNIPMDVDVSLSESEH